MKIVVGTPAELLEALSRIFPSYVHDAESEPLTHHHVLNDFLVYFGANNGSLKDRQLRQLAEIIDAAIESGGDLKNAFCTCFLEHLDHVRARKPFVPFLSPAAKQRLHV